MSELPVIQYPEPTGSTKDLCLAANDGDIAKVQELSTASNFLSPVAVLTQIEQSTPGFRIVHRLAGHGHVEALKWVLEAVRDAPAEQKESTLSACPEIFPFHRVKDALGREPASHAARMGHLQMLKFLNEFDDGQNSGPQFELIRSCRDKAGNSVLHDAVVCNHLEVVQWILSVAPELKDVKEADLDATPLELAELAQARQVIACLRGEPIPAADTESGVNLNDSAAVEAAKAEMIRKAREEIENDSSISSD
jgi:hypothetical protein